jgi:hypothetical protein
VIFKCSDRNNKCGDREVVLYFEFILEGKCKNNNTICKEETWIEYPEKIIIKNEIRSILID